jgi:hypothetical protein
MGMERKIWQGSDIGVSPDLIDGMYHRTSLGKERRKKRKDPNQRQYQVPNSYLQSDACSLYVIYNFQRRPNA